MSKNIDQIYTANPITSNTSTDLMYFGQSPYGAGDDAAMTYANFAAQFGAPYTAAALTKTNDTNVTLTLGGTPTTALLHATSLTLGWTGTLSGARGGTGTANTGLTINLGSASTGDVLTSDSSGNATWAANGYLTGAVLLSPAGVQTINGYDLVINTLTVGLGSGSVASNTAVGMQALVANTTGLNNTAIGCESLSSISTGFNNTAVGYQALMQSVSDLANTAIGVLALTKTNGGAENVGVGFYSNFSNVTGSYNVAVGFESLFTNSSDSYNTVVGYQVMYNSTSGSNNSVFGASAMFNGSGSNNTSIGYNSLYEATGGNNTALGYAAGSGGNAIVAGTNNTMLGFQAQVNNASATGVISIGSDAVSDIATGSTSSDDGPGIAIGSVYFPVGFRGDGSPYVSAGVGGMVTLPATAQGLIRIKINGTYYRIGIYPDS